MTPPRQRAWRDVPARAWRNGGGVTRELLAWPPGEAWQLRISVADIERDGPFSPFPAVARWFAVLDGGGVELALPTGPRRLRAGDEACAFDGADAPGCRLLDGPTRGLNLMLRQIGGGMRRADEGVPWQPGGGQCGLFAPLAGRVRVEEKHGAAGLIGVPAMCLSWWDEAPAQLALHADPAGRPGPPGHGWWLAARLVATPRAG